MYHVPSDEEKGDELAQRVVAVQGAHVGVLGWLEADELGCRLI